MVAVTVYMKYMYGVQVCRMQNAEYGKNLVINFAYFNFIYFIIMTYMMCAYSFSLDLIRCAQSAG